MRLPSAFLPAATLLVAITALAEPRQGTRVARLPPSAEALRPEAAVRQTLADRGRPLAPGALLISSGEAVVGGLTRTCLRQELGGVPVFRGDQIAVIGPDGPIAVVVGDVADAGRPGPFRLDAVQAAVLASAAIDGAPPPAAAFREGASASLDAAVERVDGEWTRVRLPGLDEPARAQRVLLPSGPTSCWRVELDERRDPSEWWCVLVDASSGEIRERISITDHAVVQGRVYPRGFARGSELRDFVDADVNVSAHSPAGWVAVDLTEGNNCVAYDDRRGDQQTTIGLQAQATGDPLAFDFPATGVPANDLDASLTNAFWIANTAHDWFRELGFDEGSGALQSQAFGRGGLMNDPLRVYAQYQATDAVTFARNSNATGTTTDGSVGILYIGLWNRSGELRDSAFDTGLVMHEYAHHVVVRLVGNDSACDDGTQPAGLAEGWADYFGATFTDDPVVGAYVSGNDIVGIRTARIDGNGYSYANLCNISSANCSSTENGEIWAGTLWDLRTTFKRDFGDEAGVALADRLVVEGMKFTPCRPTYPDARDGILLADLAITGGANHCAIWGVMAGRGLGASTMTTGPDDRYPVPGYDLPAECATGASLRWGYPRYGDDADARLLLGDAAAGLAARTIRVTSSSGDTEDLLAPAEPGSTGISRRLVASLRPGAAIAGDGLVQVRDGDTITATCTNCPGQPRATAAISRALAVSVLSHQLSSESCHDDDSAPNVPDFINELPSLLDAGELATVSVVLGNGERFPLEDVVVRVTCDNPDVQVLPLGPVSVGRVRERMVNPRGFTVALRALVAPSPAVQFGDTATLTFDVTARGLSGTTSLRMDLAGDYQDERGVHAFGGVETFETTSPSAAGWTHAPANGEPADEWAIRDCGNGGGRAMTYTGPSSGGACANYPDTPSAATLVSPPLFDFSNRVVGAHPVAFSWWNDVDLGYDPRSLYCDSEEVLLYVHADPNRPNYAAPRNDRNSATQGWVEWPAFGDRRDTGGWIQQTPRNAVTTNSLAGQVLADVRMRWVFFTDVYNAYNDGGCRLTDPDAMAGGYKLDDVSFTYDRVRVVAAANTSCTASCVVRTVFAISPAGGRRCPGETLTLSLEGSEAAGCAGGTLEYRVTGPGFDSGWQASAVVTAPAAGGNWVGNVRCAANTGCAQSITIADPVLDSVVAGRLIADSLRVTRDGDDVRLAWDGTRAPEAYALFRASTARGDVATRVAGLTDLAGAPPTDVLRVASPDALSFTDAGAGVDGVGVHYYRIFARMPCDGTALP